MAMPFHALVVLGLVAVLAASPAGALARGPKTNAQSAEAWAATVVTRITQADLKAGGGKRSGTVTIRLRIAADGALAGAAVEGESDSPELDERALKAVKAAAPFAPPPKKIVTLEGYTEISFPLDLGAAAR